MTSGKSLAPLHMVSAAIASCPDFGAAIDVHTANVRQDSKGMWSVPLTGVAENGVTEAMFEAVKVVCGDRAKLVVSPGGLAHVYTPGYIPSFADRIRQRSRSPLAAPRPTRITTSWLQTTVRLFALYVLWSMLSMLLVLAACFVYGEDTWVGSFMCSSYTHKLTAAADLIQQWIYTSVL